jgi:hypothetical protein
MIAQSQNLFVICVGTILLGINAEMDLDLVTRVEATIQLTTEARHASSLGGQPNRCLSCLLSIPIKEFLPTQFGGDGQNRLLLKLVELFLFYLHYLLFSRFQLLPVDFGLPPCPEDPYHSSADVAAERAIPPALIEANHLPSTASGSSITSLDRPFCRGRHITQRNSLRN